MKLLYNIIDNQNDRVYINKLLVSLFLKINNIHSVKNEFIKSLTIDNSEVNSIISTFNDENTEFHFEELIHLFEYSLSKEEKQKKGITYTPKWIREYISEKCILEQIELNKEIEKLTIVDFSCGCGAFLVSVVKIIHNKTSKSFANIFAENIYGLDIEKESIFRTKILLSLLAINEKEDRENFTFNLVNADALEYDWLREQVGIQENSGFDIILGNPPYVYGRNMNSSLKEALKDFTFTSLGTPDLYLAFFELGCKYLKDTGSLGYITPNSFITNINGRFIRQYFHQEKILLKIIDFGDAQLFKGKITYTAITFLNKMLSNKIFYIKTTPEQIINHKGIKYNTIEYDNLDFNKGWTLGKKSILNKIHKIEQTGKPLSEKYIIRTGFATLKNNIFTFKPQSEDEKYFILNGENTGHKIEKAICRKAIRVNSLGKNQTLDNALNYLIFPYKNIPTLFKNNSDYELLDELTLKTNYPFTYKYLESYKEELYKRDKGGAKDYKEWFAFGRTQGFKNNGYKLFLPKLISSTPEFRISNNKDEFFYGGYAVISNDLRSLQILKKILESSLFQFYIKQKSRPYQNGYLTLSKNYIKYFGIAKLSIDEEELILSSSQDLVNEFLLEKYNIKIST